MTCSICNHEKREAIERACLLRNFGDCEVTLKDIAKEYGVDLKDLQVHVLMHIPLEEAALETTEKLESIAGGIKRKEAQVLQNTMEDTYVTFKNLGAKINTIISQHTTDTPTMQQLTKPVIDLYLGASQSIRDTAEKLMKMNIMVNGEKDEGLNALAALVNVLKPSDN